MFYHTSCFSDYNYKFFKAPATKSATRTPNTEWGNTRLLHSETFGEIEKHIIDTLINQNGVSALSDIYTTYDSMFQEQQIKLNIYSSELKMKPQHLKTKILQRFPELSTTVYRNRTFLHRIDIPEKEKLSKGFERNEDWMSKIKSVAFHIRQKVFGMENRTMPKRNLNLQDILGGECEVPDELNCLIESLLKGPNGSKSEVKNKRVECICHSIIFSMTNGCIKPASSLYLGLTVKSLTNSRKLIDILNRMGHSISYTTVSGIETELAYGASKEKRILPVD